MKRYLAEREALIAGAVPGLESARRLARLTDATLAELANRSDCAPKGPWALVALGGYGAGALLPASDLDLLVVSDARPGDLKPFVESVLYPLWDAGLKVGHQVRSPRGQLKACREDLTTQTATLTARTLAGDIVLGDDVIASCVRDASAHRKRTLARMSERPRPGSPYLLEPDLKDGAGGRRDYDELVWTAAIIGGVRAATPAALVDSGVLSADELARLDWAAGIVAAARWESQRQGVTRGLLPLEVAVELDGDPEDLQRALADTAHLCLRVRSRLAGDAHRAPALSAEQVLSLVGSGDAGLDMLEDAAWAGLLDPYIAGFSELMTLRRPGLNHRYTVGAHSLRAACALAQLCPSEDAHRDRRGSRAEMPRPAVRSRSCAQITDRPVLTVAALAHDVGKRDAGHDHPRAGAEPAHDAALAFGFRPSRAQDVADLVRHHLVLVEVATRDDVDDEDVVLRTAARLGRRELVAPLHLLTSADSIATGPEAWGPWQEALIGTLVTRLDAALSPDVDGAGIANVAETVRTDALADATDDTIAAFVRGAPLRYLAARTPEEVIAHGRLVASLDSAPGVSDVRVGVGAGPVDATFAVAVAAPDQPEVFARVAGAFALAGLDILSADAAGTHSGVALDVFVVRSATLALPDTDTWSRFERYLKAALSNRLQLSTRLAERRRIYSDGTTTLGRTHVTFDSSAGYGTIVRVEAPDRIGLLHDVARAISDTGLDIRWAKAATAAGVARDSFLVVGPGGQAVDDPGVLGHLAMRVRELR